MNDDNVHIIENKPKNSATANKWLITSAVFILVIVLTGLGSYIFWQNKKNLSSNQSQSKSAEEIYSLLPYFAPKENRPEGYVEVPKKIVEEKKEKFFSESAKITDTTNLVTSFTASYTIVGLIKDISSEYLSDNTQVYHVDIDNGQGQIITLTLSLDEIKVSKVYVDNPGNIQELGFLNLKSGNKVEVTATLNLTSDSPNVYFIRVLD